MEAGKRWAVVLGLVLGLVVSAPSSAQVILDHIGPDSNWTDGEFSFVNNLVAPGATSGEVVFVKLPDDKIFTVDSWSQVYQSPTGPIFGPNGGFAPDMSEVAYYRTIWHPDEASMLLGHSGTYPGFAGEVTDLPTSSVSTSFFGTSADGLGLPLDTVKADGTYETPLSYQGGFLGIVAVSNIGLTGTLALSESSAPQTPGIKYYGCPTDSSCWEQSTNFGLALYGTVTPVGGNPVPVLGGLGLAVLAGGLVAAGGFALNRQSVTGRELR